MLELDAVGCVFLAFTSALYVASGWYARGYLVKDANPVRFHFFFLLAMAGNFGLILAGDIPTFYTAFALMGLASAGLLGWIRFLPLGEATMPGCGFTLISAGLGAAFLGTFVGVAQKNPKAVLAYSSISQMGIIMTGLGIGALRPDAWLEIQAALLIYATHHALAKGSLFLGVGPAHAAHTRRQRLVVGAGLLLPALALAGAPFTSGALAKTALKTNVAFLPEGWATALGLLLPLAAAGTTLKMARFLWLTWPRPGHATESSARGLWLPWLGLVVAMLVGVWLLPGALEVLPKKLSAEKLWDALWPLLVGGALAALGAGLRRWFSADPDRWLPAGDVGVFIEKLLTRVHVLVPTSAGSHEAHHHDEPLTEAGSHWSAAFATASAWLAAAERSLRSWPVAGALLLLLIGLILSLLAVARN